MHLCRFCNVHPCASQGSSQSQLKITTSGTLPFGDAVILTLSSMLRSFLRKKRIGKHCDVVPLRGGLFKTIIMINKLVCYRGHHWLRNIPLLHSFFRGIIALVHGCPNRSTSLWVSVPSSKGMPHTRVWHRSVTCHAISKAAGSSSCRLLSPMSGRVCRWRLTLLRRAPGQTAAVS